MPVNGRQNIISQMAQQRGNQYVQRFIGQLPPTQLPPKIESAQLSPIHTPTAAPAAVQRRPSSLNSSDAFSDATSSWTHWSRGDVINDVIKQLASYHKSYEQFSGSMRDPNFGRSRFASFRSINAMLDKLSLMEQTCNIWLADHKDSYVPAYVIRRHAIINLKKQIAAEKRFWLNHQQELARLKPGGNINERFETDAKSSFSRLAPIIDAAVPTTGDKCKLEVEMKIPVDPSGVGFLGMRVTGEAERPESKLVKTRAEATITGGARVANLVEIKGEIGGYIEAQGKSASQTMQLFSYALYRRFREAKYVPRGMASYMWGSDSGSMGYRRSENWAAAVEKEVFGNLTREEIEKIYAETGGVAGLSGKGGVKGAAELKAGVKGASGKRYTKSTIEAGKNQMGIGLGQAYNPGWRGAQQSLGKDVRSVELTFEAEAGPFKGELKYKRQTDGPIYKPGDWEVEVGLTGSLPFNELFKDGVASYYGLLSASGVQFSRAIFEKEKNGAQNTGAALGAGATVANAFTQLAQTPSQQFSAALKMPPHTAGTALSGAAKLKLGGKIGSQGGAITLEYLQSLGISKKNPVSELFKAELEKSNRLLQLDWAPGGGWKPKMS
jgi:hypothetical protein